MTADLWSKNNTPTFLYRFEHSGKAPKGDAFLKGLPLVSSVLGKLIVIFPINPELIFNRFYFSW